MKHKKAIIGGLTGLLGITLAINSMRTPEVEVIRGEARQRYAPAGVIDPGFVKVIDHRRQYTDKDHWRDAITYEDVNNNGTLDNVTIRYCRTRPNSWGLDSDCSFDEIALLDNSYPGGYIVARQTGTYSEVGKRSETGQALQEEFESLLRTYGEHD